MRQLLHSHVSEASVGVDGALDLMANTVVAVPGGEDDKSLVFSHPVTSVEAVPHGLRAGTTG